MIHHGDNLDVLPTLDANSIDAVVTDPPYGLSFMGKGWDHGVPGVPFWEAMLRVTKPSGYLLAFGGTRTVHRMTCAIEDAGWIIRDVLVWAYASGFPKSKSSLKPAYEPIVLARKPGPLQPLQIDAARLPTTDVFSVPQSDPSKRAGTVGTDLGISGATVEDFQRAQRESIERTQSLGRWPANIVLTDPIFDGGWDGVVGGGETTTNSQGTHGSAEYGSNGLTGWMPQSSVPRSGDTGTYSRFFLVPKASRSDREPVMPGLLVEQWRGTLDGGERLPATDQNGSGPRNGSMRANTHPTVKPLELMRHLVRLVTPAGGTVLDPFAGSGSTLLAAEQEGFAWVGIEREAEYVDIINARLQGNPLGMGLTA